MQFGKRVEVEGQSSEASTHQKQPVLGSRRA